MQIRILFLDFDGVLHPVSSSPGQGLPFEFLEVLQELLRRAPLVHVVISSSWREHYRLEQLRDFFADDLQSRIVGVTPVGPAASGASGRRQAECEAWLADNAPSVPWLALDDDAALFNDGQHALICDPSRGLNDPGVLTQLQTWLAG